MTAEVFLDTNILLYACSSDNADAENYAISEDLNHGQDYASVKVINPFLNSPITK